MTLTIKLDGNWSSFQLANNTPPLSVTGSVIAPSARMRAKGAQVIGLDPVIQYRCFIGRSELPQAVVDTLLSLHLRVRLAQPEPTGASQRSLHNAPIFRLLLKVAVKGTHQCDL